jgi:hypothetical protein
MPPPFWIEWPEPPENSTEWQKTSFHLDDVTKPGYYVITGDFRWSQGIDHYKCHVFFDPIKPEFGPITFTDSRPDNGELPVAVAPLSPTVYFKFTDNLAKMCTVSGVVHRADNNDVVGGFSSGSQGKVMQCGALNQAGLVSNIGRGLAVGKYYVVIIIRDLAGNEAMSDKTYYSLDSKGRIKPAKPVMPAKH